MRVGDICTRIVATIGSRENLEAAAASMRERHVGSLVVVDENDRLQPIGLVTDRDIVVKVVSEGLSPRTVTVEEVVAGRPLLVAREDADALDALRTLRRNGIRRLPVVDARGQLVGLVTLDDFLEAESAALADMVEAMGRGRAREAAQTA
jgi:CBS domain-containing protein